MIDVHSHILYGLDDGAKDLEESVAMVRMAAEHGTTDIVATPHANLEYKFQPGLVRERISEIQNAAGRVPRIHYGCDFHLSFDNVQDAVAHPGRYSINSLGYLLVEFSDLAIFPSTTEIFSQLIEAGMRPVITHPERNMLLQQRIGKLKEWVDLGCLIQVTGLSYLGRFGRRARQFSEILMKHGMVHVVASDAHGILDRTTALDQVRDHLESKYGEAVASRLLEETPKAMIEGRKVETIPAPAASHNSWLRFWS
jgi:protein-tyrosine phosphatase